MEITLSDDQQFFRETTVRFLATECPLTVVRDLAASDRGYDSDYWRAGAELGWTSLLVPEEHGGGTISGAGTVDLTLVADAFGAGVAPGPLLPVNVVAGALAAEAGAGQLDRWLGGLLNGSLDAAWVGAEHALGASASPDAPRVVGAASGDGLVLSGASAPVEGADPSGLLLVTARREDGRLVQALVDGSSPGVSVVPLRGVDLVRRFARVELTEVAVDAGAVLGDPADAAAAVERQLQHALVIQAAEMVGAAGRAFDLTVEWAFDRYSFGRPLASYQALKHRFADMKTWLEASHGLATTLARDVQAGAAGAPETASVTKAYLGHFLTELAQDCVQMHGGIGLTADHDLHLFLRRLTADRMTMGTPEEHRQRIGRLHLGSEAA